MLTIENTILNATKRLASAGNVSSALDASMLLSHATLKDRLTLFMYNTENVNTEHAELFESFIKRRECGEPVAYIIGEKEFWGLKFKVKKGVLIPRPDSETIVATLCALLGDKNATATIADLGVGSGALLLSILSEFPNFKGIGVDKNPIPLEVCAENAKALGFNKRVELLAGSWTEPLSEPVNIIISNPPYICSNEIPTLMDDVKNFEPSEALDGGADGLEMYKAIIPAAHNKLLSGGLLMLEIGHDQKQKVLNLLNKNMWNEVSTFKDLSGHDRVVAAIKIS